MSGTNDCIIIKNFKGHSGNWTGSSNLTVNWYQWLLQRHLCLFTVKQSTQNSANHCHLHLQTQKQRSLSLNLNQVKFTQYFITFRNELNCSDWYENSKKDLWQILLTSRAGRHRKSYPEIWGIIAAPSLLFHWRRLGGRGWCDSTIRCTDLPFMVFSSVLEWTVWSG